MELKIYFKNFMVLFCPKNVYMFYIFLHSKSFCVILFSDSSRKVRCLGQSLAFLLDINIKCSIRFSFSILEHLENRRNIDSFSEDFQRPIVLS